MMTRSEVLAIIPARGGSKGIPRKNIRIFAGHPLIAFSIAARQTPGVSRVVVSTEDEEIASIAREYGAEVPFLRPAELAGDRVTDLPVFKHALDWLESSEHYQPSLVLHLHATCPVRPQGCLEQAITLMSAHPEATCARSVVEAGQTPYKMWCIDPGSGFMRPLLSLADNPEPFNMPRQVLPAVYWQTGHVNAIRPGTIRAGSMTGTCVLPVIIDLRYLVDIDTPADWEHGEWLVSQGVQGMVLPEELK
jgi:CMP-N-acetylneuraminic acid synthetase